MRINDNGFTERVATPAALPTPPPETEKAAGSQSATGTQATASTAGDNLQLSGFAARLNSGLGADTSNRADKVSLVAQAVSDGTFRIDAAAVSRSIVTEGLQSKR